MLIFLKLKAKLLIIVKFSVEVVNNNLPFRERFPILLYGLFYGQGEKEKKRAADF